MATIDAIEYGEITVNGKVYYSDLAVWWDGRTALLEKTHVVDAALVARLLQSGPDRIVVGIGMKGTVKIAPAALKALERKKIMLFVDHTMNAREIYNAFVQAGKKPAGVFHVTL